MKLQRRYALIIISMVVVIAAALSVSLLVEFRQASRQINTLHNDILGKKLLEASSQQAYDLAAQLAVSLANPVYSLDLQAIEAMLQVVGAHPDLREIVVVGSDFRIIHDGDAVPAAFGEAYELDAAARARLADGRIQVDRNSERIRILHPIALDDQFLGALHLEYSLEAIQRNTEELQVLLDREEEKAFSRFTEASLFITLVLVIGGAIVSLYVARFIQRPILQLVHFANQMGKGRFHHKVDIDRDDELGELAKSLNNMAMRLEERTRKIQFLAFHDGLTKLPNRDYFKQSLEEAIQRARRQGSGFSLLFIDIDNFKVINDVYGHAAGDHVLITLSKRIRHSLKGAEGLSAGGMGAESRAVLGRLAGDEFIALLEGTDNRIDVATVSQRILDQVTKPFRWKDNSISLGISIGIALYPDNGDDVETLLRHADAAMYFVKNQGKNNFQFFSPQLDQQAHHQLALLEELGRAAMENELELWYQPQYRLGSGRLVGVEALLRWRHPVHGLLMPDTFMPLVEKSVHIYELGAWVIRRAVAQLESWQAIDPELSMAINISPLQLRRPGWLLQQLEGALPDRCLSPRIDLEITESFFLKAEEDAVPLLEELSKRGFHIWLDDFGTGFSSLNHLKHFPVDGIKIDRSYIADMVHQPSNLSLTRAIIQVAQAFGIRVIAEGVETSQQEFLLKQMGCSLAQGFLYSEPLPAAELEALLKVRSRGYDESRSLSS